MRLTKIGAVPCCSLSVHVHASLKEPVNTNSFSRLVAGRLLGRAHAALGEHSLAVAALDAAMESARSCGMLLSEALTVRERARLGQQQQAANHGGGSPHYWDTYACKQRLAEVMGRMGGGTLLERLLAL